MVLFTDAWYRAEYSGRLSATHCDSTDPSETIANMAIIKNPFRKQDENARPSPTPLPNGEKKDENGAKSIDVDSKEPVEYKLSGNCACDLTGQEVAADSQP